MKDVIDARATVDHVKKIREWAASGLEHVRPVAVPAPNRSRKKP